MAQNLSEGVYKWTDEHTRLLIRWRAANEALFTRRRNAAVKGFEAFVEEQGLQGRVTAAFVKKKWENLKQKYKELKCPPTGVSTEDGEPTAASWKWYSAMDEAIGGRPSITPPALIASSGPDVAVCSSSSVSPAPVRATRKRPKHLEDIIKEMEEREAEREREAAEREERRWKEMEEKEDRRERERQVRQERQEREAREREERWQREVREREERREGDQGKG
ncbi:luc7-like protein 3 [Labeo rohita]|uniref:luc7-like protein 3 n=1 Tax=Labeo rohita TaxID=84645 RepID=UPI0021E28B73|nr:luc7-like protein 3 [Labeo rohita]